MNTKFHCLNMDVPMQFILHLKTQALNKFLKRTLNAFLKCMLKINVILAESGGIQKLISRKAGKFNFFCGKQL